MGFAFCYLLGFQLLPRLKNLKKQRLYRPSAGEPDSYANLQPILTRSIHWVVIEQQYDELIKLATALRLGTADAEAILRRFTRSNGQHPTYKALCELGKALKTIFLCDFLRLESLRREIHEGLQVIETWNSANDFILYGKGGEFASNKVEDHELLMLSLHLLQVSLVYVNTLMIQQVLAEPEWQGRLTASDLRALTPLKWQHVNPYGTFTLNMQERLPWGIQPDALCYFAEISAFATLGPNCIFNSPSVDVYVNDKVAVNGGRPQTNLDALDTSGYLSLAPGTYHVALVPTGEGIDKALLGPADVSIAAEHRYTVVAMGQLSDTSHKPLVIDETAAFQAIGASPTDSVQVTVNNLKGVPALDWSLAGSTRVSNVPYGGFKAAI